MNEFSPIGPGRFRATPRPAIWAVSTFPALGCLAAASGAIAGWVFAAFLGTIALGDGAGPGQAAYDYSDAHFPKGALGFLTGYPLIVIACCVLILGATGLAAYRRWVLAVLLLVVTTALPLAQGVAFAYHLWELASVPAS